MHRCKYCQQRFAEWPHPQTLLRACQGCCDKALELSKRGHTLDAILRLPRYDVPEDVQYALPLDF